MTPGIGQAPLHADTDHPANYLDEDSEALLAKHTKARTPVSLLFTPRCARPCWSRNADFQLRHVWVPAHRKRPWTCARRCGLLETRGHVQAWWDRLGL